MYASDIQHLIAHATSTKMKHSTGEEEKEKYGPEFKVSAAEKARMQIMCGLDDEGSTIFYEYLMDCHHTSDMRTQALMFLRLFMLGGWRLNAVKPFVSHKLLSGMLPHQELQWGIQQCKVLLPAIMRPPGPSIPTGLTQAQPPLSPPFAQSQGGLYWNSYHMYASEFPHISWRTSLMMMWHVCNRDTSKFSMFIHYQYHNSNYLAPNY